ncbi:hypothetical protein BESB_052070 [Besnoitia besnoiti]|uniref:Transmembrane protein n=1 Tax=Besnoitia besnoiti TaxID=94643 RepID=A0A2A9MHY0_BESBE|nr:hypothetical protein BESB_052070 [Besnoitia besnoiti]PFH35556.1 hypothetical protein BESB_052070 [Besnoitia besnoiti]
MSPSEAAEEQLTGAGMHSEREPSPQPASEESPSASPGLALKRAAASFLLSSLEEKTSSASSPSLRSPPLSLPHPTSSSAAAPFASPPASASSSSVSSARGVLARRYLMPIPKRAETTGAMRKVAGPASHGSAGRDAYHRQHTGATRPWMWAAASLSCLACLLVWLLHRMRLHRVAVRLQKKIGSCFPPPVVYAYGRLFTFFPLSASCGWLALLFPQLALLCRVLLHLYEVACLHWFWALMFDLLGGPDSALLVVNSSPEKETRFLYGARPARAEATAEATAAADAPAARRHAMWLLLSRAVLDRLPRPKERCIGDGECLILACGGEGGGDTKEKQDAEEPGQEAAARRRRGEDNAREEGPSEHAQAGTGSRDAKDARTCQGEGEERVGEREENVEDIPREKEGEDSSSSTTTATTPRYALAGAGTGEPFASAQRGNREGVEREGQSERDEDEGDKAAQPRSCAAGDSQGSETGPRRQSERERQPERLLQERRRTSPSIRSKTGAGRSGQQSPTSEAEGRCADVEKGREREGETASEKDEAEGGGESQYSGAPLRRIWCVPPLCCFAARSKKREFRARDIRLSFLCLLPYTFLSCAVTVLSSLVPSTLFLVRASSASPREPPCAGTSCLLAGANATVEAPGASRAEEATWLRSTAMEVAVQETLQQAAVFSVMLAMWGIGAVYFATRRVLKGFNLGLKFTCIKILVLIIQAAEVAAKFRRRPAPVEPPPDAPGGAPLFPFSADADASEEGAYLELHHSLFDFILTLVALPVTLLALRTFDPCELYRLEERSPAFGGLVPLRPSGAAAPKRGNGDEGQGKGHEATQDALFAAHASDRLHVGRVTAK